MKIGLNLVGFIPGTMGGVETYIRNLIDSLQRIDHDNSYVVLCDDHYIKEFRFFNDSFRIESVNYTRPSLMWLVRGILRNTIKTDILRPLFNRLKFDVIHHPFSILNPMNIRHSSVLTFVDMQHEFLPQFFSPREMKVRREILRPSAEQAKRIIAISEHVKTSLIENYKISPGKIEVIYLGHDFRYRVYDTRILQGIRSKYGLTRAFMYYPGATWPHKNHKKLLSALGILKNRYQFDGQLVLTGIAKKSHKDILEEVRRLGLGDMVIVLGYLPYEELPYIYNLARLMVFPSLFEGFGIPLVEAMACGCAVVCSNVTSIPEVVGDCAVFFNPHSPEDMAYKIWKTWDDEEQLKIMRVRGLDRAKKFNWENTALQTIEVYRKVVEKQAA